MRPLHVILVLIGIAAILQVFLPAQAATGEAVIEAPPAQAAPRPCMTLDHVFTEATDIAAKSMGLYSIGFRFVDQQTAVLVLRQEGNPVAIAMYFVDGCLAGEQYIQAPPG